MGALCVECDAELNVGPRARVGQHAICPNCGIELEVISVNPMEVDIAYDDGEEWDDLDGYSIEDEMNMDDLDDYARINGYDDTDADMDNDWFDEELDDRAAAEGDDGEETDEDETLYARRPRG